MRVRVSELCTERWGLQQVTTCLVSAALDDVIRFYVDTETCPVRDSALTSWLT